MDKRSTNLQRYVTVLGSLCEIITTFSAAITCPEPEGIMNGKVETTGIRRVNSLAVYTCNSGYTLSGFRGRKCDENGEWEGTPPTCLLTKECKCLHNYVAYYY